MQTQFEEYHCKNVTPGPMQTVYLNNAQRLVTELCEDYKERNGSAVEVDGIYQTHRQRLKLIHEGYCQLWGDSINRICNVTAPIPRTELESAYVYDITYVNAGEIVEGAQEEVVGDAAGKLVIVNLVVGPDSDKDIFLSSNASKESNPLYSSKKVGAKTETSMSTEESTESDDDDFYEKCSGKKPKHVVVTPKLGEKSFKCKLSLLFDAYLYYLQIILIS